MHNSDVTQPVIVYKRPSRPMPPIEEERRWIQSLHDGTRVLEHPLHAQDSHHEDEFIKHVSSPVRHCRFRGEFKNPGKRWLESQTRSDHTMAFVAMAHDKGHVQEIGISRYATLDDPAQWECALTLADDWQRRGLGVLLVRHLIGIARK